MYVDIYRKPLKQISDENENSLIYKACSQLVQPLFIHDQWCYNNIFYLKDKMDIPDSIKGSPNRSNLEQISFKRDTV